MGWIAYSAILSSILVMSAIAGEGDYPICDIGKGVTFPWKFSEDVAQEECQQECEMQNKTRYGLQKYADSPTDMSTDVGCICGDFEDIADEENACNYVCGPNNITCGGDTQNPPGPSPSPFWISVYPVCDPYDTYGLNCSKPCPAHCADGCDFVTGSCIFGCDTGWDGNECTVRCPSVCLDHICSDLGGIYCTKGCDGNFFGHDCSLKCPDNCLDAQCDQANGNCKDECKPGWFGAVCGIRCPANCNGSCDSSGFCESGCEDGYYGDVCSTPCPKNCDGPSCHPVHGACSSGCADGWYGKYCGVPCSSNCNNSTCDGRTGLCTEGCSGAFFGPMCTNPCPQNCASVFCNVTTGDCIEGCLDGWRGNKCLIEIISGPAIPGWASGTMVALFLGGVVASGLVTYLVVVRRRRKRESVQFDHYNLPDEEGAAEQDHPEEIIEHERSPLEPLV